MRDNIPPVILNAVKDLKKVKRDAVEHFASWCCRSNRQVEATS
jgi:hypothetical protein